MMQKMNRYTYMFFLLYLCELHNRREVDKLELSLVSIYALKDKRVIEIELKNKLYTYVCIDVKITFLFTTR